MANSWTIEELQAEYKRNPTLIADLKAAGIAHGLNPLLPVAIASRETNIRDEAGDFEGGIPHGFGPMQEDNRSHGIPANWQADPKEILDVCCGILAASIQWARKNYPMLEWLKIGISSYNCGFGNTAAGVKDGDCDKFTTGADYGGDVLARLEVFTKLT